MMENIRFIEVLDYLKKTGVVSDYLEVASVLGTNKQGISDIKAGRKKLSIEIIKRMKTSYPDINIEYIIMGRGAMLEENKSVSNSNAPAVDIYKDMIKAKDDLIQQQKEMIEQLKGMIDQQNDMIDRLHHEILNGGQSACDATDETAALAG